MTFARDYIAEQALLMVSRVQRETIYSMRQPIEENEDDNTDTASDGTGRPGWPMDYKPVHD